MHELQSAFIDTLVHGLKRKAVTTPSKWAERYRIMGQPIPGPWSFKYHPWLREVHDAKEPQICISKAAQLGFTETVLNITCFNIDIPRRDCLYVLPTKTPDASNFSASRFDAALELSPHLEHMFSNVKNVGHKRAGSANLYIRGCNSRSGLKSIPVGFIVFDELDEMNEDNVILAEERVAGQIHWQIFKLSTPTLPNKGISKVFQISTQEHFMFKCPRCGRTTELVFPDCLFITAEDRLDPRIKESYIICKECGGRLDHEDKCNFLKDGFWVPFGDEQAETRGFHVNQLYSSADKCRPGRLAFSYLTAMIDPKEAQELYNSKLGLPYIAEGSRITENQLIDAISIGTRSKNDPFTNNGRLITMGVDQGNWLHYVICAWEFDRYRNDLNMMARCEILKEGKAVQFVELGQLMREWQIVMCVIDAQPEKRLAYELAMDFYNHIKLCFYNHSVSGRQIDHNPDQQRVLVDRTSWLDVSLNRFKNGTVTLPRDTSSEFKEHIQALVRRYKEDSNGNPVGYYDNMGPDHFAHAYSYAEIALPIAASLVTNEDIKEFL